nr:unnamed protein product [Callosobruchus chinensis]CAH7717166.1 unnamed protein product [Callosobruchus chinensis]CAH7718571.1 unnamed protein product [Callosobruchus chinensis]CAH7726305.1 unnamed protein product [Callosobruchus chinensis]CAH7726650.1 unnamed protein product [Callosobruchus chinensis]
MQSREGQFDSSVIRP